MEENYTLILPEGTTVSSSVLSRGLTNIQAYPIIHYNPVFMKDIRYRTVPLSQQSTGFKHDHRIATRPMHRVRSQALRASRHAF